MCGIVGYVGFRTAQPLLLEGNGGFGLLVPQLWQELARRSEALAPAGGSAGSTMSAS